MLSQLAEQSPALQKLLKKMQTRLMARQEIGNGVAESHYLLLTGSDLYYVYGMERGGAAAAGAAVRLHINEKTAKKHRCSRSGVLLYWVIRLPDSAR